MVSKLKFRVLAVITAICLTACPSQYESVLYEILWMRRADLEQSVKSVGAQELGDIGKFWISGSQIFICERYRGIHIINNEDPRSPVRTGFINVPGCLDIAVRGNIIYADNAADLIAYDLTENRVTARERNAFRKIAAPDGMLYTQPRNDSVIVGFKKVVHTSKSLEF